MNSKQTLRTSLKFDIEAHGSHSAETTFVLHFNNWNLYSMDQNNCTSKDLLLKIVHAYDDQEPCCINTSCTSPTHNNSNKLCSQQQGVESAKKHQETKITEYKKLHKIIVNLEIKNENNSRR